MKAAGFLFAIIMFWATATPLGGSAFRPSILVDDSPLDASRLAREVERLIGLFAFIQITTFALFWLAIFRRTGRPLLANLGTAIAWLGMATGQAPLGEPLLGTLCFTGLLATTAIDRPRWYDLSLALVAITLWPILGQPPWIAIAWLTSLAVGWSIRWDANAWRWWAMAGLAMVMLTIVAGSWRYLPESAAFAKHPNMVHVPEWRPIDFSKPSGRPVAMLASLLGLFVLQLFSTQSLRANHLVPMVVWCAWSLSQQRGIDYWWLVLGLHATDLGRDLPDPRPGPRWAGWLSGLAVAFAIGFTPATSWLLLGRTRPIEQSLHGTVAARFALETPLPPGRLLCPPSQGDLLARILGEPRVLLRDRPASYDRDLWDDAHRALNGEPDWWDLLDRLDVAIIVLPADGRFALIDRLRSSTNWHMLAEDRAMTVWVRE